MIRKLSLKTTCFALVFLLSMPVIFAQASLDEISLKEQINNSSLVIEGSVTLQRSFWDVNDGLIYTASTVEVHKVFKGEYVESIEILTQGGVVGLRALVVSHSLKLREGSLGVFTLYESDVKAESKQKTNKKQYKVYSLSQGFYKYDLYENTANNVFGKRKGIKSSFYDEIMNITKTKYKNVSSFDTESYTKKNSQKSAFLPPADISFFPTTITAGTKSVLTINGTGFGATKGKVGFRDADDGGASFLDALDNEVLTWSDTQITVEVPDYAGTGAIRITDAATPTAGIGISSASLTVTHAQINVPFDLGSGLESFQTQHYGDNNSLPDGFTGGYTWEMETGFFNDTDHPGAKSAFMRALESWRCETRVNWEVSGTATTTNVIGVDTNVPPDGDLDADGENVIMFDHAGFQLGAGVLGTCYSWYSGRGCAEVVWWVTDLDIVFDRERSWYFGESGETFDPGEIDFETVALHELGHGHQLGHVIDPSNVMHYAQSSNTSNTVLDSNSIAGANDVHSRSTGNQICDVFPSNPKPLMIDYAGSCSLSTEDAILEQGVSIYPNPTKTQLFIKNGSYLALKSATLHDLSGRNIVEYDISEGPKLKTVNLSGVSSGVYFIKIATDEASVTRKLVIE